MGIWIRSQDRRTLIKSEDIQISGTSLITMIKYSVIELGTYSSIEKTLKVLDMMENFINNLEKYVKEKYENETKCFIKFYINEPNKDKLKIHLDNIEKYVIDYYEAEAKRILRYYWFF